MRDVQQGLSNANTPFELLKEKKMKYYGIVAIFMTGTDLEGIVIMVKINFDII